MAYMGRGGVLGEMRKKREREKKSIPLYIGAWGPFLAPTINYTGGGHGKRGPWRIYWVRGMLWRRREDEGNDLPEVNIIINVHETLRILNVV